MNNLPYIDGVDFAVKIENLTKDFQKIPEIPFGRLLKKKQFQKMIWP